MSCIKGANRATDIQGMDPHADERGRAYAIQLFNNKNTVGLVREAGKGQNRLSNTEGFIYTSLVIG